MLADQMARGRLHRSDAQVMTDLPDLSLVMGGRGPAGQDTEQVLPLQRGKAGVPVISHLRTSDNRHRVRFQVIIQRPGKALGGPVLVQIAMGHLSQPVHSGIGAPGGGDGVGARFQLGQRSLYRALNRRQAFLALPPGEGGAVIFNFERVTGHECRIIPCAEIGQGVVTQAVASYLRGEGKNSGASSW